MTDALVYLLYPAFLGTAFFIGVVYTAYEVVRAVLSFFRGL